MQAAAPRASAGNEPPFNYVYKPQSASGGGMSHRVTSYGSLVRKGSIDQTIDLVEAPRNANRAYLL
ncbi:MAG: hypothetical protein AAGA32_20740 [Pseudomonadota bacterium]